MNGGDRDNTKRQHNTHTHTLSLFLSVSDSSHTPHLKCRTNRNVVALPITPMLAPKSCPRNICRGGTWRYNAVLKSERRVIDWLKNRCLHQKRFIGHWIIYHNVCCQCCNGVCVYNKPCFLTKFIVSMCACVSHLTMVLHSMTAIMLALAEEGTTTPASTCRRIQTPPENCCPVVA